MAASFMPNGYHDSPPRSSKSEHRQGPWSPRQAERRHARATPPGILPARDEDGTMFRMRPCALCGHANAAHLPYCSACGKRLRPLGAGETPPPQPGSRRPGDDSGAQGFAATVARGPARSGLVAVEAPTALAPVTLPPSVWARARESVGYVFATVRGRIDAEEQRRDLISEREGARRMAESTLVELGHAVLVQSIAAPPLRELTEAAARLKKRREAASV